MDKSRSIEQLPLADWHGPFDPSLRQSALDALEDGRVLLCANLPFRLSPNELPLLSPAVMGNDRKNISFDPANGHISNTSLSGSQAEMLGRMLRRYGDAAEALLRDLLPRYASALERARTSFRPAEIAGRSYSPRHDDRLLHVDAFPSRPMRGRRILRVFNNVAIDGAPRQWHVGEPFPDYARRFLPDVGRAPPGGAWLLHQLGVTKGRRSEYDRIMLRLHDTGKRDAGYQASGPKQPVSFAAGSTWICFTDQVLHAALAGHCALEQTFHLPVAAMEHPERSPLRVLEQFAGRSLA